MLSHDDLSMCKAMCQERSSRTIEIGDNLGGHFGDSAHQIQPIEMLRDECITSLFIVAVIMPEAA